MRRLLAISLCLAWMTTVVGGVVQAQDGSRQAALILRILSYDRNLPQRASENVTILVLHPRGSGAHEAERRRITDAINALGQRVTVARMRARAVPVAYTDRAALAARARAEGASAVYVCSGLGDATAEISAGARAARMLTLTAQEDGVRAGLSVGLVERGGEVQLLINLRAVEAEGARLDATVLRLAEVIR